MRPPYSDYAAPPVYVYPQPPRRGVQFSRTELIQLSVAILALSAAFTVANASPLIVGISAYSPTALESLFLADLVAVSTGVGLHEIMHKVVAERYGHWAEFRYSLRGLGMAFVFAFLGFIFGAPGATYISGMVTPEQNGKISAAGPLTNVVLAVGFLGLEVALLPLATVGSVARLVAGICFWAASVNLILAGFNMIPVMPLDGAKVWHWNKAIWVAIVVIVVGILWLGYSQGYLLL